MRFCPPPPKFRSGSASLRFIKTGPLFGEKRFHFHTTWTYAPQEWTDYCDSCDQGFVYVSFGSLLKGSSFSDHFTSSFVRAFEALPYCVLWKYEGEIKSKRIRTSKWMPQQQILSEFRRIRPDVTRGGGRWIDKPGIREHTTQMLPEGYAAIVSRCNIIWIFLITHG